MTISTHLTWPNRDQLLVARGETEYAWVDPAEQCLLGLEVTDVAVRGEDGPTGTVVCGDGLDALDALAARGSLRQNSIRCVYIDPPFGTGKRFGHYSDALAESTWLSMMRDRLSALRPYLADDASVWVHLDETMSHKARLILDEVFGADAYVATVVWQKRLTVESRTAISFAHDPILVYAPSGQKAWKRTRNRVPGGVEASNRDGDPRGPWRDAPFTAPGFRAGQQYVITNPAGHELRPPRGRSWFATEPTFRRLLDEDRIWWTKGGSGQPRMKNFDIDALQVPSTLWNGREVGTNDDAKRHLANLFPDSGTVFDTPKPEALLQRILHISTNPGDLVVDIFGGSGTTAAVAHKMGRQWITSERLVETVSSVLLPRLETVVSGSDTGGISESVAWSGGGAFEVLQVAPRLGNVPELCSRLSTRRGALLAG
ncbi:site-specific DNA-methyltransferase [Aestuariimicrobium sp. Y1814]|uniref:site-specific DNA-methyltransferase n=1 Tax=Aestuariimicrobium sp. Y1814 TaxID=3418742 RepID=UPI003DA75949